MGRQLEGMVCARNTRGGYALLDVLFAASIMVVALGTVASTLTAGMGVSRLNRETAAALNRAESAIEDIASRDFGEAFASFNAITADDPPGVVAPGRFFAVAGLDPRRGDADGFVGEIIFPGGGTQLREDVVDPGLGMPRDLNGDSIIDSADHSGDYVILPVRVRLEWTGARGNRQIEVVSTIANY